MGRGTQFLEEVDLKQVPRPNDSLLPVVEGNPIWYIGSKAGRGQVSDKTEVARTGLSLATGTTNLLGSAAKQCRKKASENAVGEARLKLTNSWLITAVYMVAEESNSDINDKCRSHLVIGSNMLQWEERYCNHPQVEERLMQGVYRGFYKRSTFALLDTAKDLETWSLWLLLASPLSSQIILNLSIFCPLVWFVRPKLFSTHKQTQTFPKRI